MNDYGLRMNGYKVVGEYKRFRKVEEWCGYDGVGLKEVWKCDTMTCYQNGEACVIKWLTDGKAWTTEFSSKAKANECVKRHIAEGYKRA